MVKSCEEKKSTHLFLLVGNNPLPNFVAASMLSQNQGHIHLIYTESTLQYALNLKNLFVDKLNCIPANINLIRLISPTDQFGIHQCLQDYISHEVSLSTGSIGLNYTGGMKPMSVHVYEYLKDWCRQNHRDFIHSYLDPIHYSLRFSHSLNYSINYSECNISMSDLVALHAKTITSIKSGPLFTGFCKELASYAADPANMKMLREWCDQYVRPINSKDLNAYLEGYHSEGEYEHSTEFPNLITLVDQMKRWVSSGSIGLESGNPLSDASDKGVAKEIAAIGQVGLALLDTKEIPDDEAHHWQSKSLADSIIKFLDGLWLENYVFSCLQEITPDCSIHEIKKSMYIKNAYPESTSTGFEFDVAAIQGYRLYAFSCSTSMNRSLVKGKLFEAFTRAMQMGGDESRVALVSGYLQPDNLLEEINESWMASRNKIRIFGPKDFSTLSACFKKWFDVT
jgi:hypothetical protein